MYIIKVKQYENGEYVIKIGESRRGIEGRFNEHKTKYQDPLLLDCFAVKRSKDFEHYLHTHENIRTNIVKDLPGHETETELFRIGRGLTYQSLQRIIQANIHKFNELDEKYFEQMLSSVIEKFNIQNIPDNQTALLQELLNNQKQMLRQIHILEQHVQQITNTQNTMQTQTTTGFQAPLATVGERLQRIHPETMLVDKVYETVSECMREYNYRIKRPSINKAIENNTIYHGYRWAFIGRNEESTDIANIAPTKHTRPQQVGYIAQLNPEKTEILHVYLDRKVACKYNGFQSHSSLDNPVKTGTIVRGHYYVLYDHCSDELKSQFLEKHCHGTPLVLYVDGIGQYNTEQQLIREFVCKYDCVKQNGISDRTLNRSIESGEPYHHNYYRRIGKKDSV